MQITTTRASDQPTGPFSDTVLDIATRAFQISLVITIGLYGFLLYMLFSGQVATAPKGVHVDVVHVMGIIQTVSFWLNISLLVTLVSGLVLYYDSALFGMALLLIAGFLAYGLEYCVAYLAPAGGANLIAGKAGAMLVHEIWLTAMVMGAPGLVIEAGHVLRRVLTRHHKHDLSDLTYGKGMAREHRVSRALVGAVAKCWQLPFCRESVRVHCPIYHARTKCWKQRVGCMCEQNILTLSMMQGSDQPKVGAAKEVGVGFVPIGDLLAKRAEEQRAEIPMRKGPRGVRLPTNPHLSAAEKRERCRNCIIYNEHQREKYKLLSPLITLAVPLLVYWQFDNLRMMVGTVVGVVDSAALHVSRLTHPGTASSDAMRGLTGSFTVDMILIVCVTLVLTSWALHLLEYCVFKIKI